MKTLALAAVAVLTGLPAVAAARPFPAGRCSIADDGVASRPSRGPQDTLLQPLAMALPRRPVQHGAIGGAAVIDLTFTVAANGSVSAPKILCANVRDPDYLKALMQLAPAWRFAPLPTPAAVRASYRLVVWGADRAERIPLGYTTAI